MIEITQLESESDLPPLRGLLGSARGTPFAYYPEIRPESLAANLETVVSGFLPPADEKSCYVAYAAGKPRALACWQHLAWDTEILGFGAGKVGPVVYDGESDEIGAIMGALIDRVLSKLARLRVKHISTRIYSNQLVAAHAMEERGFQLIDSILTFAYDFRKQGLAEFPHPFEIIPAGPEHHEGIMEVARRSFIYDRFHSDPHISRESADRLHRQWLRNLLEGQDADLLAAVDEGKVIGFTTGKLLKPESKALGLRLGLWILMAAVKEERRRGLGKALTYEMLRHYADQCDLFEGGTQSTNIPSARAFLGAGYKYVSSSFSLRKWSE